MEKFEKNSKDLGEPSSPSLFGAPVPLWIWKLNWNLKIEDWILKIENWNLKIENWNLNTENWNLKVENWNLKIGNWNLKIEESEIWKLKTEL